MKLLLKGAGIAGGGIIGLFVLFSGLGYCSLIRLKARLLHRPSLKL